MDVAHEWGLRPREWDRAHPGEKARMMAYTVVKRTMDAWHLEEGEKKAKRDAQREEAHTVRGGKRRRR